MGFLKSLFGTPEKKVRRVPEGCWAAAIGDIHGQLDALNALLARLERRAAASAADRKILIFLGDYVDRGLKSRQVVDRLVQGFPGFEAHFLRGNHDETLLQFLDDESVAEAWRNYGGLETLASYGVGRPAGGDWRQARLALLERLPADHRSFFQNLAMRFVLGDYQFVHAGLRPGVPLDAQSAHDMMWIRDDFLNSRADFGPLVVHGHTPKDRPDVKANRIGIDTGAYMTGILTALVLEGERAEFVTSRDG